MQSVRDEYRCESKQMFGKTNQTVTTIRPWNLESLITSFFQSHAHRDFAPASLEDA